MAILRGFPPSCCVTSWGLFGTTHPTVDGKIMKAGKIKMKVVNKFHPTLDIHPGEDRDPHDKDRIVVAVEDNNAGT